MPISFREDTPEDRAFRMEVRAFMEASVPPSIRRKMLLGQRWTREDMVSWQRILDAKGWGAPGWPSSRTTLCAVPRFRRSCRGS